MTFSEEMLKIGTRALLVQQTIEDFRCRARRPRSPTYEDWIRLRTAGERLPRGKYFSDRKAGFGHPSIGRDEFHLCR